MPIRLSPALKGLITSLLIIAVILFIHSRKNNIDPRVQYLVYILYAAGIAWALIPFRGSRFGELFSIGFRCFIVIVLVLVAFTIIFIKFHPELAVQEAQKTKDYYLKEYYEHRGDKTPVQIEEIAKKAKKQYAVTVISISIFRYLIIGVVLTAAISALLIRRL